MSVVKLLSQWIKQHISILQLTRERPRTVMSVEAPAILPLISLLICIIIIK